MRHRIVRVGRVALDRVGEVRIPTPRAARSWISFRVSRTVRPSRSRVSTTMTSALKITSEGSGDDDVYGGSGVETAVGGDQWKIEHDGQLDIQGVNQPQLMTPRPGADQEATHIVTVDRSSD